MKRMLSVYTLFLLAFVLLTGCGSNQSENKGPLSYQATNGTYEASLTIAPGNVGPNTYEAVIADEKKQAVTDGEVTLYFSMEGMEHGKSNQAMKQGEGGKWVADGPHLMMAGDWNVKLVWKDPQGEFHSFEYKVTPLD